MLSFNNKHNGEVAEDSLVTSCCVNYSAMEIYLASDAEVKVWGLASGVLLRQFIVGDAPITCIEPHTIYN